MKQNTKQIFLDQNYKCGEFYELCIQVCPSKDNDPIILYTNYLWTLDYVYGPLNECFDNIPIENEINSINHGILMLDNYEIPFCTINVCEENGYNWFDISIYKSVIEKIFGKRYIALNEISKMPNILKIFFERIAYELYKIYPFQLGIRGVEVSGYNNIKNILDNDLEDDKLIEYYIGNNNYHKLSSNNKNIITLIE